MKLDLGCGIAKPAGFIGIDIGTVDAYGKPYTPDVIHDLNNGIPFPEDFTLEDLWILVEAGNYCGSYHVPCGYQSKLVLIHNIGINMETVVF